MAELIYDAIAVSITNNVRALRGGPNSELMEGWWYLPAAAEWISPEEFATYSENGGWTTFPIQLVPEPSE